MADQGENWVAALIEFRGRKCLNREYFVFCGDHRECEAGLISNGYVKALYMPEYDSWPEIRPNEFKPDEYRKFYAICFGEFVVKGDVMRNKKRRDAAIMSGWRGPPTSAPITDLPPTLQARIVPGQNGCWL